MALIELTEDNFRDTYQNNDIVILDFWAEWCGPCHQYAPIFAENAQKHPEIVFGKINTEEQQKITNYFEIRGIPTTIVLREGIEVFRHSGVLGNIDLQNLIQNVKAIDMDKLKDEIDKESL